MKDSPLIPDSDNESTLIMPGAFDKQNLVDKLMPRLKLLRPKIIFLNEFIQSKVSGIKIVFHLFHRTIRSITNAILMYCLIFTSLAAQQNKNNFALIFRPGIGVNKLIAHKDGQFSSIPTSSSAGLNVSISTLIEYKASSRFQISTGIGLKLNQFHTEINNLITNGNINNGLNPTKIKETYTNSYTEVKNKLFES